MVTFDGFAWRIINDFGAGYGYPPPLRLLSEAECKVPGAPTGMRYADLIPTALTILEKPAVVNHYARRYLSLICDEFHDTTTRNGSSFRQSPPTSAVSCLAMSTSASTRR